jgi:hypothetical protein
MIGGVMEPLVLADLAAGPIFVAAPLEHNAQDRASCFPRSAGRSTPAQARSVAS